MSKASAKTSAPQRTLTTATNLPEKRLSAKLDKHQAQEDDNLVMSDAAPQSTDVIVSTVGAAPSMSDAPFMLAQADTATSTAASGGATTAAPTTASPLSSVLSSGWALGAAAVGAVAVVAHNTPAGAAVAATVNAVANGGIVAGPVLANNDLVVHLYAADGATQIGTATVNGSGQYTANLGNYTGVVIAKVSSTGSQLDYFDEATHQAVDLGAHVLTAVGVASATGLTLSINPLTTIAAQVAGVAADGSVSAAITATAVESANTTVATAFGITGSLIAPTALNAVVDATGSANAHADAYGKVLAVLSGLDQINGGDLQASIQAFATDLTSNNGQLSATSKFSLVVAAQDADLTSVSSGLASTIGSLAQIDASDIHEVISSGRSNFSNDELASALSTVLNTNVHVADIDAVIESITASAGNDLTSLTQAAGRYISQDFGQTLNILEAEGIVTVTVGGAVTGETVTVRFEDQYQETWQQDLTVGEGGIVELPEGILAQNIWGEGGTDTATVTVTSASSLNLTKTFGVDFSAPSVLSRSALTTEDTGYWSGYTNSGATITAPNGWNSADHWQYRVGTTGEWHNGSEFTYNENNGSYTAQLQLPNGVYGTTTDNKIYLRSYDDAGNETTEVASRWQFTVDTTAPTLSVEQDGHVTIDEMGTVILMNDAVFNAAGGNLLTGVQLAGQNQYTYVQATSDADVNQPLALNASGLTYGSYHYYAMDYAGNIATLQNGSAVTIDSHAPVVNENTGVADQTVYLGQDLSIAIDTGTIFTDPDGNPLSYTATLLDANGTAVSSDWLTLTMVDTWNLTLTATASDVAANAATGPLTIRLTATDSAGLTDKTISDDFTLTYIPEILNHAPVLEWPIGSWSVNVGVDTDYGDIQAYALDGNFSDGDNDPLTYAITNADGTPAPSWLSIHTDSNGYISLQAIPLAENVGTYHFTLTATDGLSDPVSDNFDLTVGDDGSVFYPGQGLTSFDLTLSSATTPDALSGSATLADGNSIDLGGSAYQRFYGSPALSDTAHIILDNFGGNSIASQNAPSLNLGNFSTINVDVISDTELGYLGTWKLAGADNFAAQTLTIHAGANLTVDSMDTADYANTTLTIDGSGNVALNYLDGTYALHDSTDAYISSPPSLTLNADGLTGDLAVTFNAAAATVTGGHGDDSLTFNGTSGWSGDPIAEITLTGGAGLDTFKMGAYAANAHVTVTDYNATLDNQLDLTAITDTSYGMGTSTDAPTLDAAFGFSQNGPSAIDVLGVQNGNNFDIYIDVDHDDIYTSNDVVVTLQNFTLGNNSMDALVTHIV